MRRDRFDNAMVLVLSAAAIAGMFFLARAVAGVVERREERAASARAAQSQACFEQGGELLSVLSCGQHVVTCTRAGHAVAWRAP